MKEVGSDRVVAFEPFPPNLGFFHQTVAGLEGVELRPVALSDAVGESNFFVDSTVESDTPGWGTRVGYSSLGVLISSSIGQTIMRSTRLGFKRLLGNGTGRRMTVPTSTLDAEFPTETIDFLKIDVQGSEALVLEGGRDLLRAGRVRTIYAEWSGDGEVLDILEGNGYELYDSTYTGYSPRGAMVFEAGGFEVLGELQLSTGQLALDLLYVGSEEPQRVLKRLNGSAGAWIQTDVIATREPGWLPGRI